ncbi:MAG: hypothetical protein ACPL3S_00840 [Halothiobacillaceae bacterium]|jgi:hypothetical protein
MLWLSENDLKNFFGEVIRNVAKEMKLNEWEWQFHSELLEQIKLQNAAVSQKLDAFFDAYKKWHAFHVQVEQDNKAGNLSPQETNELTTLISARDASREALLKELRS